MLFKKHQYTPFQICNTLFKANRIYLEVFYNVYFI